MVIDDIESGKYSLVRVYSRDKGLITSAEAPDVQAELMRVAKIGADVEKHRIAEVIARNLTAWDTSKDKREGLLPEVYLRNKALYKVLTGEEYSFSKACDKFCIGEW